MSNAYRVEDEEGCTTKALDVDVDRLSHASSDNSFSFESAQTEVMMKALGNNGERQTTSHSQYHLEYRVVLGCCRYYKLIKNNLRSRLHLIKLHVKLIAALHQYSSTSFIVELQFELPCLFRKHM